MLTNAKFEPFLEGVFKKYSINTPLRKAHFLAQIHHESGNFTVLSENLNYKKAIRLVTIFKSPFDLNKNNKVDPNELAIAEKYIGNPIKLANYVYANRMGNGPESSGDGWKYRGKGLIQLTGRSTQEAYAKYVGVDTSKDPEFLLSPKYALDSAGWFWMTRGLNALADDTSVTTLSNGTQVGPVTRITKKINGGVTGLDDRVANFKFYKSKLVI